MRDGSGRRPVDLPDLDKVGPAVGDGKVILAEGRGGDGVGGAAAVGRLGQEQLLGDGARLAVEGKGRDIARDARRPRSRRGEQVHGRRGAAVAARDGDEDLIGPVRGRVGESWSRVSKR